MNHLVNLSRVSKYHFMDSLVLPKATVTVSHFLSKIDKIIESEIYIHSANIFLIKRLGSDQDGYVLHHEFNI
jgi:hypothetical protein